MSNQVQAVKFYDDTLITLEKDGEHYVAVRPIVENMGIDWAKQSTKLKNPKFSCCLMATTGKDGKNYQMLCIPVKKLNGWLFSINPERVRAEVRPIVEQYQEECFAVLHDYWHKGVAVNERADVSLMPATLSDMKPLPKPMFRPAADSRFTCALDNMITQVAKCYVDNMQATNHIRQQLAYVCGVDNINFINPERLPTALQALSFMAHEANQHQELIKQVDNNGILALRVKTTVQGFLE